MRAVRWLPPRARRRRSPRTRSSRARSEEHTSELQSPCNLVCRLLLEKKKNEKDIFAPIVKYPVVHIVPTRSGTQNDLYINNTDIHSNFAQVTIRHYHTVHIVLYS